MSEFEMASLHIDLFNAVQMSITLFLSVLSGFVVMSYLAAHRLDRVTAIIGMIAFVGYSALNLAGTAATLRTYARLSREMHDHASAGRGLDWHHASEAPLWLVDRLEPMLLIGGMIIVVAALRFFLHYRRLNSRQAQATA